MMVRQWVICLIPIILHASTNGFRGWRGTGEASRFVEDAARTAPFVGEGFNPVMLECCRVVARILDNDDHPELWADAENALVETLQRFWCEPDEHRLAVVQS